MSNADKIKQWRNENSGQQVTTAVLLEILEVKYLRGIDLSHANLEDADLRQTDLEGTNLEGAWLARANLSGAILVNANLNDADLTLSTMVSVNFQNATLRNADFVQTNLIESSFAHADLTDADLAGANLMNVSFAHANLTRSNFGSAYLRGANLQGANLTDTYLYSARLENICHDSGILLISGIEPLPVPASSHAIKQFPSFAKSVTMRPTPNGWKIQTSNWNGDLDALEFFIDQCEQQRDLSEGVVKDLKRARALIALCKAHADVHVHTLSRIQESWNNPQTEDD